MILLCSLIGIGAAVGVYVLHTTIYESQAKLLVRYVVDTSAIDQVDSKATVGPTSDNLINAEVEILKSWDLAMQVAASLGPERLLPKSNGGATIPDAAISIRLGLIATSLPGTNMILVSYRNPNPELAALVLKDLVARYFTKHLEVHRSADAFDFVSRQSDQVRARLNQAEEELKTLKAEAGITSLKDNTTNLNAELAKTKEALQTAETELAEQQARVDKLEKSFIDSEKTLAGAVNQPSSGDVVLYQALGTRLDRLNQIHLELLSRYSQGFDQPEIVTDPRNNTLRPRLGRTAVAGSKLPYSDREMAQQIARDRYRSQNDTGFAYQASKKSFDQLVREAAQELLVQRNTSAQQSKASQSLLVQLNQEQIENAEKQKLQLEKKFPTIATMMVDPS
ncbi:MAG TPA: hypothetical protein VIT23_07190, partial [Terrimicrobiaceae bacterium]